MHQRNQGYSQGIWLGVLQGLHFRRLLEIHFLVDLGRKGYSYQISKCRSVRGSNMTPRALPYNSTLGFAYFVTLNLIDV